MVSSVIHKLEKLVPFFIIKPGTCAVCVGSAHHQRLRGAAQGHSQGGPLSSVCSAQWLESRGHGGPCLLCSWLPQAP